MTENNKDNNKNIFVKIIEWCKRSFLQPKILVQKIAPYLLICFVFLAIFTITKEILKQYTNNSVLKNEIYLPINKHPKIINFYFDAQSVFVYKQNYNYSIFSFNKQNYEYKKISDIMLKNNYIIFPYQGDKIIFFNANYPKHSKIFNIHLAKFYDYIFNTIPINLTRNLYIEKYAFVKNENKLFIRQDLEPIIINVPNNNYKDSVYINCENKNKFDLCFINTNELVCYKKNNNNKLSQFCRIKIPKNLSDNVEIFSTCLFKDSNSSETYNAGIIIDKTNKLIYLFNPIDLSIKELKVSSDLKNLNMLIPKGFSFINWLFFYDNTNINIYKIDMISAELKKIKTYKISFDEYECLGPWMDNFNGKHKFLLIGINKKTNNTKQYILTIY